MAKLLFHKKVEKSLLKDGMTLPVASVEPVLKTVGAVLGKGSKVTIDILLEGTAYPATLTHVDYSESQRDVYQIRYSAGSDICRKLNEIFAESFASACGAPHMEVWSAEGRKLEFRCFPDTAKNAFFEYLGERDSLKGYVRSYKLVFYKCYFSEEHYGEAVDVGTFVKAFRQYYIDRIRSGLQPDFDVDAVIADPIHSTGAEILSLIMKNPFRYISEKGFFERITTPDSDTFRILPELYQTLTAEDLEEIRQVVHTKLALYYSRSK